MPRLSYFTALIIIATLAGCAVRGSNISSKNTATELKTARALVKAHFVDPVDDKLLQATTTSEMLSNIDPYAAYIPSTTNAADAPCNRGGCAGSVGVQLQRRGELIQLVTVIRGGPAARAGLLGRDRLVKIDQISADKLSLEDAIDLLQGPVNSAIEISYTRPGVPGIRAITLTRERVQAQRPEFSQIEPNILSIRIPEFGRGIAAQLRNELVRTTGRKIDGLIIDLRDNPGGLLLEAVSLADTFLEWGMIVEIKGRNPQYTKRFMASEGHLLPGVQIVILTNSRTASSAEVVAGSLQAHGRAVIAGERTLGKGSIQSVLPLSKNAAIKLTTARYYLSGQGEVEGVGVAPDLVNNCAGQDPTNSYTSKSSITANVDCLQAIGRDYLLAQKCPNDYVRKTRWLEAALL